MKTKYVIECTEDNVTCTLRQHFTLYYPDLNHDLVQFPLIHLYYGVIDGEIKAVPSYQESYACLSVDEADKLMYSEGSKKATYGAMPVVQDDDSSMRIIALEHAVKIGHENDSEIESIVKSAEKFLGFLKGKKETVFEYAVNGWIEIKGNESLLREMIEKDCQLRTSDGQEFKSEDNLPIFAADVTHFKIVY